MKELKQRTIEWLSERFGKELYNDLCCKQTVEYAADYFIENNSTDEIELFGGLDCALESWFEEYTPAEEMESLYNEKQIEMLQENACAVWQGLPCVYTEEEIWDAE
ncbi:MAG TPA: hypothetical protein GX717_01190 [Clostridiaceae bacterium]|nr:hypothetical protein [Clostridiaceae bacterium]